jgi:hypothetical protein
MKIVSVNVGLPREVTWRGTRTTTGIYKGPVRGRVALRRLNLDGDRQADLTVHGGEFKAVAALSTRFAQDRVACPFASSRPKRLFGFLPGLLCWRTGLRLAFEGSS